MMITTIALLAALAQNESPAAVDAAKATDAAATDRATAAAERAAIASEKAAAAMERLANALAPGAAAGPATDKPTESKWGGSIGAGFSFITGNAQTLTITGNLGVDKKWENWGMGIRMSGAYGLANPSANVAGTTSTVNALRGAASVRGERSFGESFASIFVLGGAEADHMKNIEFRGYGEAGTGLTFFNKKEGDLEKVFLRLDLAARAGAETRQNYFPLPLHVDPYAIVILAPRAGVVFRCAFSSYVRFSEELEFIPFLLAPTSGRLLINNTTKLNARITENLSLSTAVVLNYDSMPPPATVPRLPLDVALTAGIEAAF